MVFGVCWRCGDDHVQLLPDPLDDNDNVDTWVCIACYYHLQKLIEEVEN